MPIILVIGYIVGGVMAAFILGPMPAPAHWSGPAIGGIFGLVVSFGGFIGAGIAFVIHKIV